MSAAFHLNNKEAKRELKVNFNNETLPFCSNRIYLGVMLDRSLTHRRYLESLRKKLTSRVPLLRPGWGVGATTLRIATLALVHSTAEYCAPVWCRSAHTCLIDPDINDTSRIVTVCLRPTPTDNLPILAYIHLADLCHNEATLSLGRRAIECTCTARITNGMRLGEQTHKTPHFHSQHRHPPSRYDLPKKSLGLAQPPSHQCRTFPFLLVQMGYGLLCGL